MKDVVPTAHRFAHKGTVFARPELLEAAQALMPGRQVWVEAGIGADRAALCAWRQRGGARECFADVLRSTATSQTPWAGLTYQDPSDATLKALRDAVFSDNWDMAEIGPFPDFDDATVRFADLCRERASAVRQEVREVWIARDLPDAEAVVAAQSPNTRRNTRRALKRLEARGAVEVEHLTGHRSLEGLARFVAVDRESWKATDGEAIASDAKLLRYWHHVMATFGPSREAVVTVMSVDGRDVAATIGLVGWGWGYILKGSFAGTPGLDAFSPGQLCNLFGVGWMLEVAGLRQVAVMSDKDYGRRLANGAARVTYLRIWNDTPRARLLAGVQGCLRLAGRTGRRLLGRTHRGTDIREGDRE